MSEALSKQQLLDLAKQVDPNVEIDDDVANVLLDLADQFVEEVTVVSCQLAKHRGGDRLEARDLKLCLEKNYDIRAPGFVSTETKPGAVKRPGTGNDAHRQRVEKVRRTNL
eukprot:CAMPEP_0119405862 /NCGR_PEP_ID=MMETSP1335-20130426/414_1 /TAXON_ID=259385 /ORGANISM="Chrysoculter rhomboideus, Strain RCC1486" /LENGTH=110 /DNA_ID=CAMNT_0007429909 /DNA_START=59 /DNA_END=391 /DNA_ORIENTATION=+